MTDVSRNRASFNIGADLFSKPPGALPNARGVTERLGIEPSHVHDPGERKNDKWAPFKHGLWSLDSPLPQEQELEHHIRWLLDRLLPVREEVLAIVRSDSRLRANFFCGLYLREWNERLVLSPRTLADIASLGAELDLDLYWEAEESTSEPKGLSSNQTT